MVEGKLDRATPKGRILVVDDDRNLVELVRTRLESAQYDVEAVMSGNEAIGAVRETGCDLSIIDLRLEEGDGIELMGRVHELDPGMPVIILTAHGSIESAVEAMRRGAYSYLTKPFESQDLLLQIDRALENRRLNCEIQRLKGLLEERYNFSNIIARSARMKTVLDTVARIAKTDSTVYIHGESGTGKELIAKAIHLASERSGKTFVALNCAALPESLLESELFGHERGAFTGAVRSTKGLFTQAHEGTLFLDEIGDMPLATQSKLLRALEERQFYPVGGERPLDVNVRVIVATNKDLEKEVRKGLFREDLFYRIHVIPIHLPPLRERKEEIVPLVEHFIEKLSGQMKKEIQGVTPEALQRLMLHDWPGNVRELENTVEYAIAMTQKDMITEEYILRTKTPASEGGAAARSFWTVRNNGADQDAIRPLKEARDAYERDYLIQILSRTEGNVTRAARLAGKYRADLYDLLRKHELKAEDFKKSK